MIPKDSEKFRLIKIDISQNINFDVLRKLFTDTMMSTPSTDEVSRVPDPDPYEAAGILTYDSSFNSTLLDSNMNSSSILTMAAENSGINLEEDLLTTPSKHTFDMDMDMDLDN